MADCISAVKGPTIPSKRNQGSVPDETARMVDIQWQVIVSHDKVVDTAFTVKGVDVDKIKNRKASLVVPCNRLRSLSILECFQTAP